MSWDVDLAAGGELGRVLRLQQAGLGGERGLVLAAARLAAARPGVPPVRRAHRAPARQSCSSAVQRQPG